MARFVEVHDAYETNWVNVDMVQRVAQSEIDPDGVTEWKVELSGAHSCSIFGGEGQSYTFEEADAIATDMRLPSKSVEVKVHGFAEPKSIHADWVALVNSNMGGYRLFMVGGAVWNVMVGGDDEYTWDEATALLAELLGADFEVIQLRQKVRALEAENKRLQRRLDKWKDGVGRYEEVLKRLDRLESHLTGMDGEMIPVCELRSRIEALDGKDAKAMYGEVRNEQGDC